MLTSYQEEKCLWFGLGPSKLLFLSFQNQGPLQLKISYNNTIQNFSTFVHLNYRNQHFLSTQASIEAPFISQTSSRSHEKDVFLD